VERFVTPDEFNGYAAMARGKGFALVSSSPLTRSSYHADADFAKLKETRERMHKQHEKSNETTRESSHVYA
jgi:lipoic acid synthetase